MTSPLVVSPVVDRLLRSVTDPTGGRVQGAALVRLIDGGAGALEIAPQFAEHAVARTHLEALAMSPLLGSPRRSARLVDSITHVGVDVARTVAIHWACGALDGSRSSLPVGYWEHAVATASAARAVAANMRVSGARVVSAALIHNVGRALLQRSDPAKYQRLSMANSDERDLCRAEERSYGCHHGEISAAVLRHFESGADLIEAVARHHSTGSRRHAPLTVALAAGAIIADHLDVDDGMVIAEQVLVASGLGFVRPDRLVDRVREDVDASVTFLAVA